jgi:preprotein translocase subunit SecY
MLTTLTQIWESKLLRTQILFTLAGLIVYRFIAAIPVPGIDLFAVRQVFASNSLLGVFSVLTGGSASNFSIVLMGISPYINASIIMQLMTVVIPKLEAMSKEGDAGRQKITSITRWLTLPLAFLQSYGMILLINNSVRGIQVIDTSNFMNVLPVMLIITAGTILLMWLGEIMTEYGIANGISILIFASILSGIPGILGQSLGLAKYNQSQLFSFIVVIFITLLMTAFVVIVSESQRNIPITYAGRSTAGRPGGAAAIPIRINQAGMIPIIFAVSLITFPQVIASFLQNARSEWLRNVSTFILENFNQSGALYTFFLFLFVYGFTYFYVSITFNPVQIAENIQKRGGFIPGVRPGRHTAEFLQNVSSRLTFWGGLFLAFISVFPFILSGIFAQFQTGSVPLLIGGAGLIIIVGVVLEIVRRINTGLIMYDYDKLY